jgi:hypothetical protein
MPSDNAADEERHRITTQSMIMSAARPLLVADLPPEVIELDRLQGILEREMTCLDHYGMRYRMVDGHLLFIVPGDCPFPGMDCRDSGHSELRREEPGEPTRYEPTGYDVRHFVEEMELWDMAPQVQLLDDGTLPTEEQVLLEMHLDELNKAAAAEQAWMAAADHNPQGGEAEGDDDVVRGVGLPRAQIFNPYMS